jgi:hypothetical protein
MFLYTARLFIAPFDAGLNMRPINRMRRVSEEGRRLIEGRERVPTMRRTLVTFASRLAQGSH